MNSTPKQIRHNEDKPQLSYFFANERSYARFQENYGKGEWLAETSAHEAYIVALESINDFLASGSGGSWADLVDALSTVMAIVEHDQAPDPDVAYAGGPWEFVASVPYALAEYCRVCVYGEAKYSRGNYRLGAPVTEYLDSALRHLRSILNGEMYDRESSLLHAGFLMWNLWQALDQPGRRDNRLPAVDPFPFQVSFGVVPTEPLGEPMECHA